MIKILEKLLDLAQLLGIAGTCAFVGLWWVDSLALSTPGGSGASLFRAIGALPFLALMFYRWVWVPRMHHSQFKLCFYIVLTAFAIGGFFYGYLISSK